MTTKERMEVLKAWAEYTASAALLYDKVGSAQSTSFESNFNKAIFLV